MRHLKPQEYHRLVALDQQLGFVATPHGREFEGTRPFAAPERPKQDSRKQNAKQGEPI